MASKYINLIADELSLATNKVSAAVDLLENGGTIPFIARYRKEATGSLDEVQLTEIRDRFHDLVEIDKRRLAILESIKEQGKLTDELKQKILSAPSLTVLEDIYLPYKPKRRTKATVAKEKGLEPLAVMIFEQKGVDPEKEAVNFVNKEKGVLSTSEALAGARDIIAEWISEDQKAREKLRELFQEKAVITAKVVKGKESDGIKYKDYFEWQELARTAPSHRVLAVRRGEKETFLIVRTLPPEEDAFYILKMLFVKTRGPDSAQVQEASVDSYKRLLSLSLENEIRLELKKKADREAINYFKDNLRALLMAPALGQKRVLAIDPGFRTGCKVVCLNEQGKLLHNDVIYPESNKLESGNKIKKLCEEFKIEFIAIGNGTASRETESFVRSLGLKNIQVIMVNESGASIYSASDVAREEFPNYDITVRGAVSIGRRLMDPLAELVKIDPKSIGIGQYQHDVDQNLLKVSLDDVVMSCVNSVGVEVNTASKQLLMYVSGLGPALAQAVVKYRDEHGPFKSRESLKKVPGLGPKAFEQAAGFLRIRNAENPLDSSAVHPESYETVELMAKDSGCTVKDLVLQENFRKRIDLKKYVTETVGLPTLQDIFKELAKPGRDPREEFQIFSFKEGINTIEQLKPGMKLPGVITNITAFGAFCDIGVHHDGLIHISQISDKYIKSPDEVLKLQQRVMVTVVEVDLERKRIALTLKGK